MQTLDNLLTETLGRAEPAMLFDLSIRLHAYFRGKYILETDDCDFDLDNFIKEGKCTALLADEVHARRQAEWLGVEAGAKNSLANGMIQVKWNGVKLRVLRVQVDEYGGQRHFLIGETEGEAKDFFRAVCTFNTYVHGEILVFENGGWRRDASLLKQIRTSSLDQLVLPGSVRDEIVDDIESFFAAEALYAKYGLAWKRGVLLLGPPGNGKTHLIKALIHRLQKPTLYVRSFRHRNGRESGISIVFSRARKTAPCLLVLEDLDTIVTDECRSYFLNELDGFASNHGILTLATTNHPDKLDPALLERPSRFDRKLTFALPEHDQRRQFLCGMTDKWEPEMRLRDEEIAEIAHATEGFSYAYMKELCLSGMIGWMKERKAGSMQQVMLRHLESLRLQMKAEAAKQRKEGDDDLD